MFTALSFFLYVCMFVGCFGVINKYIMCQVGCKTLLTHPTYLSILIYWCDVVPGLSDSSQDHSFVSVASAPLSSSSSSSSTSNVPLAKLILTLDGQAAKLQALRHLLTTLQIIYARYAVILSNMLVTFFIAFSSVYHHISYTPFIVLIIT